MIVLNVAQKGEELKKALLSSEIANDFKIIFIKKIGMKYFFEAENQEDAIIKMKNFIKNNPHFSFLYTSLTIQN